MSIAEIWKSNVKLPTVAEMQVLKAEHICIKPFEPEKDGYIFLHGAAIVNFKGKMYCTWAHNKEYENSGMEELNYAVSADGGMTWSDCIKGECAPEEGIAVSHGVFLIFEDRLYLFAPVYRDSIYSDVFRMCAYCLNEETERFEYIGVVLDEHFWPMCEPVLMENGNYILPGIFLADTWNSAGNTAAVAISHGSDILHWDMVKLEHEDSIRVWGECCVIADGYHVKLYCRENMGIHKALYSESFDYGRTWIPMEISNLPMIDSKPYAGRLSNGRGYLICSCAEDIRCRSPLTIALTEKGEEKFSCIYKITEGNALSYPYAVETDGKLYIVYSSGSAMNRNSAMLAIIDMEDFA